MNRKNIGQNLRVLRKQNKMTQEQLAEKANVSTDHISHIEIGTNAMSVSLLVEICKILNVSPNDILAGEFETKKNLDNLHDKVLVLNDISPNDRIILDYIYQFMVNRN